MFIQLEGRSKRTDLNLEYQPPSDRPTYLVLVHENLVPYNQSLHLDLECSSQLGKLDLHPILQRPTNKN